MLTDPSNHIKIVIFFEVENWLRFDNIKQVDNRQFCLRIYSRLVIYFESTSLCHRIKTVYANRKAIDRFRQGTNQANILFASNRNELQPENRQHLWWNTLY